MTGKERAGFCRAVFFVLMDSQNTVHVLLTCVFVLI